MLKIQKASKRSISPVVAMILLITITVAISGGLLVFATTLMNKATSTSATQQLTKSLFVYQISSDDSYFDEKTGNLVLVLLSNQKEDYIPLEVEFYDTSNNKLIFHKLIYYPANINFGRNLITIPLNNITKLFKSLNLKVGTYKISIINPNNRNNKFETLMNVIAIINISNTNNFDIDNYQVEIPLSSIKEKLERIGYRFWLIDSSGNKVNYCFEQPNNECNSTPSDIIWAKVNLHANSNNTIYLIESNKIAANNGKDVFLVYEDFDEDTDCIIRNITVPNGWANVSLKDGFIILEGKGNISNSTHIWLAKIIDNIDLASESYLVETRFIIDNWELNKAELLLSIFIRWVDSRKSSLTYYWFDVGTYNWSKQNWSIEELNITNNNIVTDNKVEGNLIKNGTWYNITMIITPNKATLYVNGTQEITLDRRLFFKPTELDLIHIDSPFYFKARMDYFIVRKYVTNEPRAYVSG